jgi:hypothetical protein
MRAAFVVAISLAVGCGSNPNPTTDLGPAVDMAVSVDAAGQVGSHCDAFAQTGCGPGLRCTIGALSDGSGAEVCVPTYANAIGEDGACTPIQMGGVMGDFCAPGLSCVSYGSISRCRKLCLQHSDCGDDNHTCAAPTNSPTVRKVMGMDTQLLACIVADACDPVAQTGCPANAACYLSGADSLSRVFVCEVPSSKHLPVESPCTARIDCAPGSICVSQGFCRAFCYVNGAASVDGGTIGSCPDGFSCIAFAGDQYGTCE